MTQAIENIVPGNVKTAMKEAGASSGDLWMVPYDQLRIVPGFNVRVRDAEYIAHLKHIKGLIAANGFDRRHPFEGYVSVEDGKNIINVTGGHTRHEAVGELIAAGTEFGPLPVIVATKGTSAEELTAALVTGNSGKPLRPNELAAVIKRLIGFSWDVGRVATTLNLTKPYVNDLLSLAEAPAAVRKLVDAGKVSATLAIEQIKKAPEKAAANLKAAVEKAEAKGKAKATKADTKPAKEKTPKKPKPAAGEPEQVQQALSLSDDGKVDLVSTILTDYSGSIASTDASISEPARRECAEKIIATLFPVKSAAAEEL